MKLDRCDICNQAITDFNHQVVLGYGIPELRYSFCPSCAKPIIEFLENHGLESFSKANGITWNEGDR
jgi:hypothetical protein